MRTPRILESHEHVGRFIYSDRHIGRSAARPKPGAFFPPLPYSELSVAHTDGLSEAEVWKIARKTLKPGPRRDKIYARADIPVQALSDLKLRALRDDMPFLRHTNVIDWPVGSDNDDTKALCKKICLDLSEDLRIQLAIPDAPVTRS